MFVMIMKKLLIVLLLLPISLIAQMKGLSQFDTQSIFGQDLLNKAGQDELMKGDAMPTGNVIDPEHYFIGPGDVLSVQSIVFSLDNELMMVSPDNTLLLPRIGTIDLNGKTLADAQKIIREAIEKRNPNTTGYVILAKPRTVLVTISGDVKHPGNYYLPASYQTSTAVKVANQQKEQPSASMLKTHAELKKQYKQSIVEDFYSESGIAPELFYYQRNVYVLRNDGGSVVADFEKAKIENLPSLDPYIREGDHINVPSTPKTYPFISINGAVNRPCKILYKRGDKISTLLKMGYGLNDNADINNIEVFFPGEGKEKLKIDRDCNLLSADTEVLPGTIINVGSVENGNIIENGIVAVSGEVKFPGTYVIREGTTRLRDIIEMAGGFTERAYLPLANIMRQSDEFKPSRYDPRSEINRYFMHTNLTLDDTVRYQSMIQYSLPIVSTDFVACFENDSEKDNIDLYSGDLISVPKKPHSVYVFGQVKNPGYITYVENQTMEWYIKQAGGFSETADKGRSSIIKGKNNVWIEGDDDIFVEAGDKIYVPNPPDMPPGVELQTYAVIASSISALAILINVLVSLF
jgi:protein involved in polysaccharide export with SLBB domain